MQYLLVDQTLLLQQAIYLLRFFKVAARNGDLLSVLEVGVLLGDVGHGASPRVEIVGEWILRDLHPFFVFIVEALRL